MAKKITSTVLAAVGVLLSLFSSAMMTMFIVQCFKGGPDARIFAILAASMAALDLTGFLLVNTANTLNDEADGYKNNSTRISRWVKNLVFACLIVVFLMLMILTSIDRREWIERNPWVLTVMLFAVCGASVIYLNRFGRYAARRRRIRSLKYASPSCHNRRFHFTVYKTENGLCSGFVQGKIMTGDKVYVLLPGSDKAVLAKVQKIIAAGKETGKAADCYASVMFECPVSIVPFTVISTQYPDHVIENMIRAENPRVSGIISVYNDHYAEDEYIGILNYDICHGCYLVPARNTAGGNGDMMFPLRDQTAVSFLSVNTVARPDLACLPVFTDWDALGRYGYVIEDPASTVLILDFEKCRQLMQTGYTGIVINPFGPRPFYLGSDYIRSLTELPEYQKEFMKEEEKE